jgi:hypothetical protein
MVRGRGLGLSLGLVLFGASCAVEVDGRSRKIEARLENTPATSKDADGTSTTAASTATATHAPSKPAHVGERIEIHGLPVLRLAGSPREMGFQHGRALAAGIKQGFEEFVLQHRCHGIRARYEQIAKRVDTEVDFPERIRAELDGMMEGMKASGLDLAVPMLKRDLKTIDLAVLNSIDHWGLFGCSGFTAWGRCTDDGGVLCARNFDFDVDREKQAIARLGLVLVFEPNDGHRFVSFAFPGLIGAVTGLSDAGVGVFLHVGNGGFGGGEVGRSLPPAMIARTVLEECAPAGAAKRARDLLAICNIRNSYLFRVVTTGEGAPPTTVFEVDPRGFEEQKLPDGSKDEPPLLVTTNHYLTRGALFEAIPDSQIRWSNLEDAESKCLAAGDRVIDASEAWTGLAAVKQEGFILTLHSIVWKPRTQELWAALSQFDGARARAAPRKDPVKLKLDELFADA